MALLALATQACSPDMRLQAVRTSLEAVRVGTETAEGLANAAALDAEEEYLDEIAALPPPERPPRAVAEDGLAQLRLAWDERLRAFSAVRAAHATALEVYQSVVDGDRPLEVLEDALDEVLALFLEVQRLMTDLLGDDDA